MAAFDEPRIQNRILDMHLTSPATSHKRWVFSQGSTRKESPSMWPITRRCRTEQRRNVKTACLLFGSLMSEDNENKILEHLTRYPSQSVSDVSDATRINSIESRRLLRKLQNEGELTMSTEQRKVKGWYRVTKIQVWSRSNSEQSE